MALTAQPGARDASGDAANGAVPKQRLPARYGLTRGWSRIGPRETSSRERRCPEARKNAVSMYKKK